MFLYFFIVPINPTHLDVLNPSLPGLSKSSAWLDNLCTVFPTLSLSLYQFLIHRRSQSGPYRKRWCLQGKLLFARMWPSRWNMDDAAWCSSVGLRIWISCQGRCRCHIDGHRSLHQTYDYLVMICKKFRNYFHLMMNLTKRKTFKYGWFIKDWLFLPFQKNLHMFWTIVKAPNVGQY